MREIAEHEHTLQRVEKIPAPKLDGYTLIRECINCEYRIITWEHDKQEILHNYD